jgi:hypothetical protein
MTKHTFPTRSNLNFWSLANVSSDVAYLEEDENYSIDTPTKGFLHSTERLLSLMT